MPRERATAILIVEDDAGTAALEQRHLERAGYAADTAGNAAEALARLDQRRYDLLVLDYRLEGEADGLALYHRIKEAGHDLPVVLVTGFSDEATVIRALRAGVRDFVPKTVEYLDYLPEAVGRVLRQVRTEQRLAESEARLAGVIKSAKDAILVTEADRRITLFNEAAEQMFRCPVAQAMGQPLGRFIPRELATAEGGVDDPSVTNLVRSGSRGVRADGSEFPLEATFSRVEVGGRKIYTVVVRDVTERKRLEAQLLQAQRMEGVGVLAGGVAHDFNNMLTVITGCSEILLGRMAPDDDGRELIEEIRKAGERAALLTRQLLAFSRKQILRNVVLDLNALIQDMEKLLSRLIREDIDLAAVLSAGGAWVRADPGQLQQVIMNLVVNARDAMPTGGQLTLATHLVDLDAAYATEHPYVRPGPYVLLAVTDTGHGMDEVTRSHIFEPFFTTKGVGVGTGLGLATVYGVVKQSGGSIEVYSEPGHGTVFKIYLPRISDAAALGAPAEAVVVPRGRETVLLAEDEEGVRTIIRLSLTSVGYTVLESKNVDEAVQICREYEGQIHMLLTDVVMPKMSGRQLADLLLAMRPAMKVLYMSGYTDDSVVRHGVLAAGMAFLQKPFAPLTLARKVREVLDK